MSKIEQNIESTKEERDILFKLKYIGYCHAHMPPRDLDKNLEVTYADFVNFCKFTLCEKRGVLLKDPIWEKYADEEIIFEFFASLYYTNKDSCEEFKALIRGEDPDLLSWFDEQIEKNRKEIEEKLGDEDIQFDPNDIQEIG